MKVVFTLILLASLGLMAGCGDRAGSASSAATPVAAAPGLVSPPDPAPPMPTHFYAIKDGQEYAYEKAISEADKQQGKVAASLMMFSYLGRKGDTYQVMVKVDNVRSIAECTKPCEFAKIYTFIGNQFSNKEILKLAPTAIVTTVFADAMNNQLDPLLGEQKGTPVTFWVDGERKRLVVDDAKISGVTR